MARYEYRYIANMVGQDEPRATVSRYDLSGGENTRIHRKNLVENQGEEVTNVDISVPGKITKRKGSQLIGNDVSDSSVVALHNFAIQGDTDQLIMAEGTNIRKWEGSGNWSSALYASISGTDVGIISAKESGLSPDDIIIVQDGTNNAQRIDSAGNVQDLGSTTGAGASPPLSTVMGWYGNRVWVLKNEQLYFSDAYDDDYSSCFDTVTNWYRIPVGEERALVSTRDLGIVVFGKDQVWSLLPSTVPVATDQPVPIITDAGAVSKNAVAIGADDVYFFAQDGLRALKRNMQDKLQQGVSYPLSYPLRTRFNNISWGYISKLSVEYFENQIICSVPVSETTYETWIYNIASQGWTVIEGQAPRCWAKYKIDGEESLYYGKDGDGTVYQEFTGYTDESTDGTDGEDIEMTIRFRQEDLNLPLRKKATGEIEVRASDTTNFTLNIYISFDDGDYEYIGDLAVTGTGITFPTTFPVSFSEGGIDPEKLQLDQYGEWRNAQVKLVESSAQGEDITVLETNLIGFAQEYENDD